MEYLLQEGTITLPDDFYDRTVNTFALGSTIPAPLSVTVARDNMLPDETMPSYVKRQMQLMQAHIKGYKLVDHKEMKLPSNPNIEGAHIEAYYKSEGKYYYQRQAAFEIYPKRILVFSCTSQEQFTKQQDKLWQDLLASYKQRENSTQSK
ncbi:DcrB-related protein [Entomomonas asaccharolytica]|uniref:DUF1795 domain-containing protein n=1 Tax=Entomomonas asaccharolytica TaxID=2785331 RepID=A0A974NE58_9GAMM|nr:DUF1795 domain-containing protein [Entomomonas asaccharolytica]QQP84807.1 DUF1795 domain-containing protein [Entomomonas asaccharolytica]